MAKSAATLSVEKTLYTSHILVRITMIDTTHNGLTHWGRVTHICVGNLTIIGSDDGLSPGRRQAIIWTNARILLIGPWGANFNEIVIGIQTFSLKKMFLKMSSGKWRPLSLGLNVLIQRQCYRTWRSLKCVYKNTDGLPEKLTSVYSMA